MQIILLILLLTSGSFAHYHGQAITMDTVLNFINETSYVYKTVISKEVSPLLQTTDDEIAKAGYPVEVHQIYTEDGQLLTMHRIAGPSWRRKSNYNGRKQPILIMHGVLGSSQLWVQLPPNKALAYNLADQGYDVWLGNFRTNYYSRSNIKYSSKDPRLWDASIHEMGLYDLPAMIDHIILETGYQKVFYIGHSMGTTTFLIMCSLKPKYNDKIKASFLLSPVALPVPGGEELSPLLRILGLPNAGFIYKTLTNLRLYEVFPRNEYLYKFLYANCGPSNLQNFCLDMGNQLLGINRRNINMKEFGKYAIASVAGTSAKTLYHLAQIFSSGEFKFFNYGPKWNLYKYGQEVPPNYPLNKVTAPIFMYYGLSDRIMSTKSVNRLAKILPNVIKIEAVGDPAFTHTDVVFGNNAKKLLYDRIIAIIRSFDFSKKASILT